MSRRSSVLPALLFALLTFTACSDSEAQTYQVGPVLTDTTLAVVVTSPGHADTLTVDEFNQQFLNLLRQYPQVVQEDGGDASVRRQIVDDFVAMHVLTAEAEGIEFETDEAAIDAQFEEIRGSFESDSLYRAFLVERGITEGEIRAQFANQQRLQAYMEQHAESIPEVTDAEYEEFEAERQAENGQTCARHILFLTQGVADDSLAAVRAEAERVLAEVQAGGDFPALAREHSEDPGSGANGGDLGCFPRGQMVPEFEEAAFALPDSGAVTDQLVETQFGFHIIQSTGRADAPAVPEDRVRAYLREQNRLENLREIVEGRYGDVTVRVNAELIDPAILEEPREEEGEDDS